MQRENVLSALAAAKDLPQLSLVDALELTVLVARKDPCRHPRVAGAGFCASCEVWENRRVASNRKGGV